MSNQIPVAIILSKPSRAAKGDVTGSKRIHLFDNRVILRRFFFVFFFFSLLFISFNI